MFLHRENHGLGIPAGLAGWVAGGAGAGLKFPPATNPHPHGFSFWPSSTIDLLIPLPPDPPPTDLSTSTPPTDSGTHNTLSLTHCRCNTHLFDFLCGSPSVLGRLGPLGYFVPLRPSFCPVLDSWLFCSDCSFVALPLSPLFLRTYA